MPTREVTEEVKKAMKFDGWCAVAYWAVIGGVVELAVRWWLADVIPF